MVYQLNDYLIIQELMSREQPTQLVVERAGRSRRLEIRNSGTYIGSLSGLNQLAALFWLMIGALELVLASILAFSQPRSPSVTSAALFLAVITTLNTQSAGVAEAFRLLPVGLKLLIYPVRLLSLELLFFAFLFCANFPRPIFKKASSRVLSALPASVIFLYLVLLNLPISFGSRPGELFEIGVGKYFDVVKIPML